MRNFSLNQDKLNRTNNIKEWVAKYTFINDNLQTF